MNEYETNKHTWLRKTLGVHITFVKLFISRFQRVVGLQSKPLRDLIPDCLPSCVNRGNKLLPTFTAHRQSTQILPVYPFGMVQHVYHLAEREQRISIAPRCDPPDGAQRIERDEVKRVAAGLSTRTTLGGGTVLDLRVEESGNGALQNLPPAERKHQIIMREHDGRRVLHGHRRREER